MSRYIKDSEAKESLYTMFGITSSAAITAIDIAIDKTPTADVQEVKHGKWFFTDFYDSHKNPIYQCSVCMKEVADHYIDNHKYCLHCGAVMDSKI